MLLNLQFFLLTDQKYFVTASYDRTFKLWENE